MMATPPEAVSSTTGDTASYTIPPEEPKPTNASHGEEVKPPMCTKCGVICYDGERLKDKKIYCRQCLKAIVEAVLDRMKEIKDEANSKKLWILNELEKIYEAKHD